MVVAGDAPFDDGAFVCDGKEAVDVIITVVAPEEPLVCVSVITDVITSSDVCNGGADEVVVGEGASIVADELLVVVVVEGSDTVGVGDVVADSVSEVRLLTLEVVMGTTVKRIAALAYGPCLRYSQDCMSFDGGVNHTGGIPRHHELRFSDWDLRAV